jgi:hypothetical protein
MAKRKSPSGDQSDAGITSLYNAHGGDEMHAAALHIEEANKRAQRYETVTLTDLAMWPAVIDYAALPKRLQHHVKESYMWSELRKPDVSFHNITQQFDQLTDAERATLVHQLCDIHAIIEYTLRSQVLPEYIDNHTVGGQQTVHWEPVAPGSSTHHKRQLTLQRMESMPAGSRVPGAQGMLLDYYDWRLDQSDTGMLHLLHRDLPSAPISKEVDCDEDEEETETTGHKAQPPDQSQHEALRVLM